MLSPPFDQSLCPHAGVIGCDEEHPHTQKGVSGPFDKKRTRCKRPGWEKESIVQRRLQTMLRPQDPPPRALREG